MPTSCYSLRDRSGRLMSTKALKTLTPTQGGPSFYKWGDPGPGRVSDLLKVIQLVWMGPRLESFSLRDFGTIPPLLPRHKQSCCLEGLHRG